MSADQRARRVPSSPAPRAEWGSRRSSSATAASTALTSERRSSHTKRSWTRPTNSSRSSSRTGSRSSARSRVSVRSSAGGHPGGGAPLRVARALPAFIPSRAQSDGCLRSCEARRMCKKSMSVASEESGRPALGIRGPPGGGHQGGTQDWVGVVRHRCFWLEPAAACWGKPLPRFPGLGSLGGELLTSVAQPWEWSVRRGRCPSLGR